MAAIIAAIIFAGLIVLEILGHRKYQVKRKLPDWIFLCIFIAGAAVSFWIGAQGTFLAKKTADTGRYLAYRYLLDGDTDGARAILSQDDRVDPVQKEVLKMLAHALDRDYKRSFFISDELLSKPEALGRQKNVTEEVYTLSMSAAADGSNQSKKMEEYAKESYDASGITETMELQEYYDIDKKIRAYDTDDISESKIRALTKSFPDESSPKKLAISYFVLTGDFDSALEIAGELMNTEKSAASRVIYTDIMAQMAYQMSEEQLRSLTDPEAADLLAKSDSASEKAASSEEGSDNYYKWTDAAAQDLEDAREIFYRRAENYIKTRKPFFADKTALYDLQLIKLGYLQGERDKAVKAFYKLLENASSLSETSPVKDPLIRMNSDLSNYLRSPESEDKEQIFTDCKEVFLAQGQDVLKTATNNINTDVPEHLAAMLAYDLENFTITDIATADYPKVTVTLNTNLKKANVFGGAGEYYRDDFRVRENSETVSEFNMNASLGTKERSAVIACRITDTDPAVSKEIVLALETAPDLDTARRLAIVDANASVVSGFDSSDAAYRVRAANTAVNGNASIQEIITGSCEMLTEKKYEDKAIVLISDDASLTAAEAGECAAILRQNNVKCSIIAMEGMNEETASLITAGSGGILIPVSRPFEVTAALEALSDLMNNVYTFTYKAPESITGKHIVTVMLINEEKEAAGEYLREGTS